MFLACFSFLSLLFLIQAKTTDTVNRRNNDGLLYVCGKNATYSECSCKYDDQLICALKYPRVKKKIYCPNIKILDKKFIFSSALFSYCSITVLKKGKVLPNYEHLIETLKFHGNNMTYIEDGTFEKFISLKYLEIGFNFLKEVTPEIWGPNITVKLEKLYIFNNNFESIPSISFKRLTQLKELIIGEKNIDYTSKDAEFPIDLSNLEVLIMFDCNIKTLNENIFKNLRNLKKLKLHDNPLTALPASLKSLTNLQILDLERTKLRTLNECQFKYNTKLEFLNAAYSKLQSIHGCAFCNLPKLKSVDLRNNPYLSYIDEDAFGSISTKNMPILRSFYISACNISVLPEKLLDWHKIEYFNIQENPFTCNCSMAWLINDARHWIPQTPFTFLHKSGHSSNLNCYKDSVEYSFVEASKNLTQNC